MPVIPDRTYLDSIPPIGPLDVERGFGALRWIKRRPMVGRTAFDLGGAEVVLDASLALDDDGKPSLELHPYATIAVSVADETAAHQAVAALADWAEVDVPDLATGGSPPLSFRAPITSSATWRDRDGLRWEITTIYFGFPHEAPPRIHVMVGPVVEGEGTAERQLKGRLVLEDADHAEAVVTGFARGLLDPDAGIT